MRVVADTNIVVSGLLWPGPSRQIMTMARQGLVELFTSGILLAELKDVLHREKFINRLAAAQVSPQDLVAGYAALANFVHPAGIAPVVLRDPDDDSVIACAVAAAVAKIVSGDRDLLTLKRYQDIDIVTAPELLEQIRRG